MHGLLLSIFLLAGQTYASTGPSSSATAGTPPRRLAEIDRAMWAAIRAEAAAETDAEQLEAVRSMAEIYGQILTDPRFATSETLQSHRARLWSRMTRIQRDMQRRLQRERRHQDSDYSPEQQQVVEAATRSLAEQTALLGYTMGGPPYVLLQSGGAMGGAAVQDHAQELINLIQRTIKPDFWDTAGGPGSMFYYRPLMALVVSATSEVHGHVGGLLEALRRAGQ
jgi:hypothetical protein